MKNCKEVVRYKIYNEENPNIIIAFHIHKGIWKTKHIHKYWEIMLIIKDSCINNINGKETVLSEGDLQIIRPDDIHFIESYKNQEQINLNIEIREQFVYNLFNLIDPVTYELLLKQETIASIHCSGEKKNKYLDLVNKAQLCSFPASAERQDKLKLLVSNIIIDYLNSFQSNLNLDTVTAKIITEMRKPDNICLGLKEICNKLNYDVVYAIRHFKKEKMETPNKIFRDIKLDYACGLLDSTDYRIIDIAEKIGFGSVGHFNQIFQEKFDMSPNEYRSIHKQGNRI